MTYMSLLIALSSGYLAIDASVECNPSFDPQPLPSDTTLLYMNRLSGSEDADIQFSLLEQDVVTPAFRRRFRVNYFADEAAEQSDRKFLPISDIYDYTSGIFPTYHHTEPSPVEKSVSSGQFDQILSLGEGDVLDLPYVETLTNEETGQSSKRSAVATVSFDGCKSVRIEDEEHVARIYELQYSFGYLTYGTESDSVDSKARILIDQETGIILQRSIWEDGEYKFAMELAKYPEL